ncbi:MAG TPA: serine hydrolase domain-containing protein [Caulobacteraceae bacterium]|jgi:CubicO group peptidase (beta-lactamase class C family)
MRLVVLVAVLSGVVACTTPNASRRTAEVANAPAARGEPALQGKFDALRAAGYSGAAVVTRNGRRVFGEAAGEAAPGVPFTTATAVDVASIAKPITGMAVAKLMDQGKLSLDDTLGRWFPDAPADKRSITVRQLLSHSAGVVDIPEGLTDYTPINRESMLGKLLAAPLDFPPGTKSSYSNGGYQLLAFIVENASGREFFEFLEAEIFRAAQVVASYDPTRFPENEVARGRGRHQGWIDVRSQGDPAKGPFWGLWGAGGIFISTEDMARLMDAYLAGRIVSPEAVRLAVTPVIRAGDYASETAGWTILHSRRGTPIISYTGGSGHSQASLRHYPEAGVTIATAGNTVAPGAIRVSRELAEPLIGPDFDPVTPAPLPGTPVQPGSREEALVHALLGAVTGGPAQRAGFLNEGAAPGLRAQRTDVQWAERFDSWAAAFPNPVTRAIHRDGDTLLVVVDRLEGERPSPLRIELSLVEAGGRLLVDRIAVRRA